MLYPIGDFPPPFKSYAFHIYLKYVRYINLTLLYDKLIVIDFNNMFNVSTENAWYIYLICVYGKFSKTN